MENPVGDVRLALSLGASETGLVMFDLLVLLVIGLSTAFAALRGGLRELSTLIALAIAGGLTLALAEPILTVTGQTGSFFGTILIAAILVAAFFIVAHIGLHLGLKRMPLEGRAKLIDRISGGAFGFLRGLILVGLGYLGYSYYLDEARQPDEVRNAITRPVAAGVAHWFESFTPDEAYIESAAPESDENKEDVDAAENGYDRSDRNGLSEIVTTVTTTDETTTDETADDETTADETPSQEEDADKSDDESTDDISDILEKEDPE